MLLLFLMAVLSGGLLPTVYLLFNKINIQLTRIRHDKRRQTREGLIRGDIESSIIQRFDLVMLHMVPSSLLPILDTEAESMRVMLRWPHEEGPSRVDFSQKQLIRFFPGDVRKEPTAT